MLVIIRTPANTLPALDVARITSIEPIEREGSIYNRIWIDERGQLASYFTTEPIESLVRRINQGRQGNYPAPPPEVEP